MLNDLKTTIVIADDHTLFADGVEQVLAGEPDLYVLAKCTDGKLLMQTLNSRLPNLILLDIHMPLMDGLEVAAIIKQKYPGIKIIIISMILEKKIKLRLQSIGVEGYIGKSIDSGTLIKTIRQVLSGHIVYELKEIASITDEVLPEELSKYKLSAREIQIIRLIREGLSTKKIAENLVLSEYTIETHRKNILRKLRLHTPAEIIAFANRHNI